MLFEEKTNLLGKGVVDIPRDGLDHIEPETDERDLMEPIASSIILIDENGNEVSVKELYKVLKEDLHE